MKVTFEFDTDAETFDRTQLECYYQAESMARCINEITNKLRLWEKYDERKKLPKAEIYDSIWEIINEYVNLEKMGY